jgi:hypothetical protein
MAASTDGLHRKGMLTFTHPARVMPECLTREVDMPTFIIERDVPGAGKLSKEDLCEMSAKSNDVVDGLGEPYTWITSYVAGDKIYCVHEAASADVIREHAKRAGFPANKVTEVNAQIGPETANAR